MTNGIKEANSGGNIGLFLGRFGIKAVVIEGRPTDDNAYVVKIDKDGSSLLVMNELNNWARMRRINNSEPSSARISVSFASGLPAKTV